MRAALLGLVLLAACGGSGGEGDLPDAGPSPDAGPAPATPRRGLVELVETDGWFSYTRISARFFTGEEPRYHTLHLEQGDCRLVRFGAASCDPACTTGFCTAPNQCTPFPTYVSAGQLTATGLAAPLSMTPDEQNGYWPPNMPQDLFDEGDAITVTLAGATLPAHQLATTGVAAIDSPQIVDDALRLSNDADTTITWTPTPGSDARVRLTLNANNAGHGHPYEAIITCDVADSAGQITVPKELAVAFPATIKWEACAGSDCPPSDLMRYRAAYADVPDGHVQLVVGHARLLGVNHEAAP